MAAAIVSPHFSFDAASGRLTENTATGVTTLFAWPVIHAFRRSVATGRSVTFTPAVAILPERRSDDVYRFERVAGLDEHTQDAIERFCATIPQRVRRTIAQFTERQWEVLAWVARAGLPAEELLASNSALAFAVANLADVLPIAMSRRSAETQRWLLPSRKQRDILERLAFAPTERVRRILRKVMPASVSITALALLRDQLQKPAVSERLAHVRAIGPRVLALIDNDTIDHVTLAALEAFARADGMSTDGHTAALLVNAARVWGTERAGTPPTPPGGQRSRRGPVGRGPELVYHTVEKPDFPPAPFPGTGAIVPILYRAWLFDEARQQNNCVVDYAPDVIRGKIAIYRVLAPERCTLSLKLRRGHWVVDQLKGWGNREPGAEVVQAINQWLETSIRSARSLD